MFSPTTKEAANITKDLAVNDVKTSANRVERAARSKANSVVEDLSEYAHTAGQSVRHFIDSANDEVHHAADKVKGEIRENPVRSTLVALGVGALIGALLRR